MTTSHSPGTLVVLNVPPRLEEAVVDWLLAREEGTGFTSFPVSGHSTQHNHLSAAEQVAGRQRRLQFQVQMKSEAAEQFLEEAKSFLDQADVHFWVLPIIASGQFGG